jgi:hypothetical protein
LSVNLKGLGHTQFEYFCRYFESQPGSKALVSEQSLERSRRNLLCPWLRGWLVPLCKVGSDLGPGMQPQLLEYVADVSGNGVL